MPSIDSNLLQKLTQLEFPNLSHNRLEVVTSQAWTALSNLNTLLLSPASWSAAWPWGRSSPLRLHLWPA